MRFSCGCQYIQWASWYTVTVDTRCFIHLCFLLRYIIDLIWFNFILFWVVCVWQLFCPMVGCLEWGPREWHMFMMGVMLGRGAIWRVSWWCSVLWQVSCWCAVLCDKCHVGARCYANFSSRLKNQSSQNVSIHTSPGCPGEREREMWSAR